MPCLPTALLAGALDHLLRFTLNGCDQSARHAAYLLDRLSNQDDMGDELRDLCQRMSESLEEIPASNSLSTHKIASQTALTA